MNEILSRIIQRKAFIKHRLALCIAAIRLSATVATDNSQADDNQTVERWDAVVSLPGGVIVCPGFENGEELTAVRLRESFLVQGLDTHRTKIISARKDLASRNLQGLVTARAFDGRRLPYIDNMVNFVLVADRFRVPDKEILRNEHYGLSPDDKGMSLNWAVTGV